ncbi:hypothetical protein EJB05_32308, partial [Eragrostis curvula]
MGDGKGEPLLVKKRAARYHPGCPGCRVERLKEEREGVFPLPDLFRIWLVTVCSSACSIASTSLFPITSPSPFGRYCFAVLLLSCSGWFLDHFNSVLSNNSNVMVRLGTPDQALYTI